MPVPSAHGTVARMMDLYDMEERLMDAILRDHGVTVTLSGLRGTRGGFEVLLPEVPRPGDRLTFALKRRRGQGRYVVESVEWIVAEQKEVIVHLVPEETPPGQQKGARSSG